MVKYDPATRALLRARLILHVAGLSDGDLARLMVAESPKLDLFPEEQAAIDKYAESLLVETKS